MDSRHLIDFIENSSGFDSEARLNALLVATKVKPAAFIRLRISQNLEDKAHFEKHLRESGILFSVSRPKGFEEIVSVRGSTVRWAFRGIWYGYDLFDSQRTKELFLKYKGLIREQKRAEAARVGGKVYKYPACCVKQFIRELDVKSIAKQFSYGEYFGRLHDSDWKFPFVFHTACSASCTESGKLNDRYRVAIKKHARDFFTQYTAKTVVRVPLIINVENDILDNGRSIWPRRSMHDYMAIVSKRVHNRFYLVSFLTKQGYAEGDVVDAQVTFQYRFAKVRPLKVVKHLRNLHHERRMSV